MFHATSARIRHGKGRLVLTVLAVALGVAFLTGSLVLADSTRSALDDSYAQVYAGVDIVVRGREAIGDSAFSGGGAPLPATVIERTRGVGDVARTEGRISTVAQLTPVEGYGAPTATTSPWLIPGHHPGRPLNPGHLGLRLRRVGVPTMAGRRATLLQLAAELPAAVLADLLNLSVGTAVGWVNNAGGDWSRYAATIARQHDHTP